MRFLFATNNIVVGSCGCTYHPFCIAIHFEGKFEICASPTCDKNFENEWITSISYKCSNIPWLERPEVEPPLQMLAPHAA